MTEKELKQALKSEILNFDGKKLSEEQIITIASEIGYKRIKPVGLELSGNKISLKAMKYVTQAVSRCPSLVYLSMIGCELNDDSVNLIAKHLANHPLLCLLLLDNNITQKGEIILSEMLATNKHILEFNAQFNSMNTSTDMALFFNRDVSFLHAAKSNNTLISFTIEANQIPDRYTDDIYAKISDNRKRFEKDIMPNIELLSQYKIPQSLVDYLKTRVISGRTFNLLSDPLIAIAEQQKKLLLAVEKSDTVSENIKTSKTLLFSPQKQLKIVSAAKVVECEKENINPNLPKSNVLS